MRKITVALIAVLAIIIGYHSGAWHRERQIQQQFRDELERVQQAQRPRPHKAPVAPPAPPVFIPEPVA